MESFWQGPYVVAQVLSSVLCKIRDRKKATVIHHDPVMIVMYQNGWNGCNNVSLVVVMLTPFVCTQFMDSSGLFEPSHPSEDIAGFHGSTMEDGDAPIMDKKNRQPFGL